MRTFHQLNVYLMDLIFIDNPQIDYDEFGPWE